MVGQLEADPATDNAADVKDEVEVDTSLDKRQHRAEIRAGKRKVVEAHEVRPVPI